MSARHREKIETRGKSNFKFLNLIYRWWEWYADCNDPLSLCSTNAFTKARMAGDSLAAALEDGELCNFSIQDLTPEDGNQIPRNYFCSWSVDIDINKVYYLSIKRDHYPVKETIELNIIG